MTPQPGDEPPPPGPSRSQSTSTPSFKRKKKNRIHPSPEMEKLESVRLPKSKPIVVAWSVPKLPPPSPENPLQDHPPPPPPPPPPKRSLDVELKVPKVIRRSVPDRLPSLPPPPVSESLSSLDDIIVKEQEPSPSLLKSVMMVKRARAHRHFPKQFHAKESEKMVVDEAKLWEYPTKRLISKKMATQIFGNRSNLSGWDSGEMLVRMSSKKFKGHSHEDFGDFEDFSDDDTRSWRSGHQDSMTGEEMVSDDEEGPDKSWILNDSEVSELDEDLEDIEHGRPDSSVSLRALQNFRDKCSFLWGLTIFAGQMPLQMTINRKERTIEYKVNKCQGRYWYFIFTSIFFLAILILSFSTSWYIYSTYKEEVALEKSDKKYNKTHVPSIEDVPYMKYLLLLYEKYWLFYLVFLSNLIIISVYNYWMFMHEAVIIAFLTDLTNTVLRYRCDPGLGFTWLIYTHFGGVLIGCFYRFLMYVTYPSITRGITGTASVTAVSLLHFFHSTFMTNLTIYNYANVGAFVLMLYVIFCAHMTLVFIISWAFLMACMGIKWVRQLNLMLSLPVTGQGQPERKGILSERSLFIFHNQIIRLMNSYSIHFFPSTIVIYLLCTLLILFYSVVRLIKLFGIRFGRRRYDDGVDFNSTRVEFVDEPYNDGSSSYLDVTICLSFTVVQLIGTSEIWIKSNHILMRGLEYVRRCLLEGRPIMNIRRRKFIMSLEMSLSGRRSMIAISPYFLFGITRSLLIVIVSFLYIITLCMIQSELNPIIKTDINGLCNNTVCVIGSISGPFFGPGKVAAHKHNEDVEREMQKKSKPKPGPKPKPSPGEEYDHLFSNLFSTCPYMDILKPNAYDEYWEQVSLPTDRLDCMLDPYSMWENKDKRLYDVFYNDVTSKPDRDKFDDCGQLPFPLRETFQTQIEKFNEEKPGIKQEKPKYPDKKVSTRLEDGTTVNCWPPLQYNKEGSSTLDADAGPEGGTIKEYEPITCGLPTHVAPLVCGHWDKESKSSLKTKILAQVDKLDRSRPEPSPSGQKYCSEWNYDEYFLRDEGLILREDVTFKDNGITTLATLVPLTKDGKKWPLNRSQRGRKHIFAPTTSGSISQPGKPGLYYDCFGYLMNEVDDCGRLPFSIVRNGKRQYPGRENVQFSANIDGKTITKTVSCFVSHFSGYKCGIPMSSTLDKNYSPNPVLYYSCMAGDYFKNGQSSVFSQFYGED